MGMNFVGAGQRCEINKMWRACAIHRYLQRLYSSSRNPHLVSYPSIFFVILYSVSRLIQFVDTGRRFRIVCAARESVLRSYHFGTLSVRNSL